MTLKRAYGHRLYWDYNKIVHMEPIGWCIWFLREGSWEAAGKTTQLHSNGSFYKLGSWFWRGLKRGILLCLGPYLVSLIVGNSHLTHFIPPAEAAVLEYMDRPPKCCDVATPHECPCICWDSRRMTVMQIQILWFRLQHGFF